MELDIDIVAVSPYVKENRLGNTCLMPETRLNEPGPEDARVIFDTEEPDFNQNVEFWKANEESMEFITQIPDVAEVK